MGKSLIPRAKYLMGAFFLYNSITDFDIDSVKNTFSSKGFSEPSIFRLGKLTLWLYKKQLINYDNFVLSNDDYSLFATGTVIYKNNTYQDSLLLLLKDFQTDCLEINKLKGAFCLFFFRQDHLYMLSDRTNIYHIFTNTKNTIFSSSFLAILNAQKTKAELNIDACLEQLLTGFVTPPDTIISGIEFYHNNCIKNFTNPNLTFLNQGQNDQINETFDFHNFDTAVEKQILNLKTYYSSISNFAIENKLDIGLSGGFDSRLNFLLSKYSLADTQTHTYISQDHITEAMIAEKLAAKFNVPLKKIKLNKAISKCEEELIYNFEDALFFYDGRTNFSMGTYNDVHTRKLRVSVLGSYKLGLNGLGGEIFRNREHLPSKINFLDWIRYVLMKPSTVYALKDKKQFEYMLYYILSKYKKLVNLDSTEFSNFSLYYARKLFNYIWIPYAAGIKNSAENQLSFFLMPFTDYMIGLNALKATPFIGIDGKFEAAMITELNEEVASITSSYGYRFNKIPFVSKIDSFIKCIIPIRIKYLRHIYHLQKLDRNIGASIFLPLLDKYHIINKIFKVLNATQIPINWNRIMLDKPNMERTLYLGYFLLRFNKKIDIGN
ncbi:MAG: hypothetical protein GF353_03490 [Candidatus Lokiarchaeota archaeon]|nr:hypothetical protein [Candidatus Lokiarchaeota archaeon]